MEISDRVCNNKESKSAAALSLPFSQCVCVCAWFDRVKLPFRKMYHGKVTLQLLLLDISHTVKKSGGKRGKKSLRTLKTNKQKKGYLTLGYLAYSLRRIKTI